MHEAAVVTHVVDQRVEVHFKNGLMHLQRQEVAQFVEMELACSFDKDELVLEMVEDFAVDECLGGAEGVVLHREVIGTCMDFFAHTYHLLDASRCSHLCHTGVEAAGRFATLQDVAQNQGAVLFDCFGATTHKVEGDVERVDIRIVGVVDECAAILTVLHLQSHGHLFQSAHALAQLLDADAHVQCQHRGEAGDGVLDGGIVDEVDGVLAHHAVMLEMHGGVMTFLFDLPYI